MAEGELLLVDGTGLFYRSYFAIKGLASRDGHPTNAVFGFVRAIHGMIERWNPAHLAVAWDGGSPRERLALLPEYKAQRPPMPEPLRHQYPWVREFLELARIPLLRMEQQEADDILATVACWAAREVPAVLISSSDKDLYQLVNDKVRIVSAGKDETQVGPAEVLERTGVQPGQVVEWLALTGDTVDNIPGVPGLGPKTAAKLLQQFGSLAVMWERLAEIDSDRLRERLLAGRSIVELNLGLVRLKYDLDCLPGWDPMRVRPEDPERIRPFYERMEFHSLVRKGDQRELF
jgi:DNA polymerase-1